MALTQFVTELLEDLTSPSAKPVEAAAPGETTTAADVELSSSDDFLNLSILEEIRQEDNASAHNSFNQLTKRLINREAEFNSLKSDETVDESSDSFCHFLNDLVKEPEASQRVKNVEISTPKAAPSSFLQNFAHVDQISSICSPKITSFLSMEQQELDFRELELKEQESYRLRCELQQKSIERLCRVTEPSTSQDAPIPVVLRPPSPSVENVSLEPPVTRYKMLQIEPRQVRLNLGVCLREFLEYSNDKSFEVIFPEISGGFADVLRETENANLERLACRVYLDKAITDCKCAKFLDICRKSLGARGFPEWLQRRLSNEVFTSEALAASIITIGKDFRAPTEEQRLTKNAKMHGMSLTARTTVSPATTGNEASVNTEAQSLAENIAKDKTVVKPCKVVAHDNISTLKEHKSTNDSRPAVQERINAANAGIVISEPRKASSVKIERQRNAKSPIIQSNVNHNAQKRASSVEAYGKPAQEAKITSILNKYNENHPERPPLLFKEVEKLLVEANIIPAHMAAAVSEPMKNTERTRSPMADSPKKAHCKIDANAHAMHSPKPSILDSRVLTRENLQKVHSASAPRSSSITQYSQSKATEKNVILLKNARKFSRRIAGDDMYEFEAARRVKFSQRVEGVSYEKFAAEIGVWENNYLDDNDQMD